MKNLQKKAMMFFVAALLSAPAAFATNIDDCYDAPIDGGLSLLAAAGVGYGIKKVIEKKEKESGKHRKVIPHDSRTGE